MNAYRLSAIPIFLLLFMSSAASAQTTGSITGTVFDRSGAIIQNVAITITQKDTGQVRHEYTDSQGRYHAPDLPVGDYEVKSVYEGFQSVVRSGILITIGRNAVVDIVMQLGAMAESVMVSADAGLVDTSSSQLTGLVQTQQIENLPLNGRDYSSLVLLTSGTRASPVGTGSAVTVLTRMGTLGH